MNHSITRFVALFSTLMLAGHCTAQQARPATPSTGTNVAVIDISFIFKNHNRFKAQMEAMKKDVTAFEQTLRARGGEIEKLKKAMTTFAPGTPEYKQKEEQITKMNAAAQADAQLKRNEFLDREARIYYDVYNEIVATTAQFAKRKNIRLVVRFNSEKIDPANRRSVLDGVNRAIVVQDSLDITGIILGHINARGANTATRPGTTNQTAPGRRVVN